MPSIHLMPLLLSPSLEALCFVIENESVINSIQRRLLARDTLQYTGA